MAPRFFPIIKEFLEVKEMVREEKIWHTFKKNVPYYNVGVRRSFTDTDGVILTNEFPTVRVEEDDLRDFKMANKYGLINGLIIEVEEDDLEWDLSNALTDEQVVELTKNYAKLKSVLPTVTSPAIAQKILAIAKENERGKQVIKLIESHVKEITPDEDEIIRREDMQQSYDDTRY